MQNILLKKKDKQVRHEFSYRIGDVCFKFQFLLKLTKKNCDQITTIPDALCTNTKTSYPSGIICIQMWWLVDFTLKKIKTAPVGVVAQDFTDFICIAHTQQVNFVKKRIKKVRNRDHKSSESDETPNQACKIINEILLQPDKKSGMCSLTDLAKFALSFSSC